MKELKIIATIVAKEEFDREVYTSITKVVDGTRQEAGNISYAAHRSTSNPLQYVILEHWSSQEAIDLHNQSAHFQAFVAEIEGKTEGLDVAIVKEIY